jgi:hypothetical protein
LLQGPGISKDFFRYKTPKSLGNKSKIDKRDYKLKSFYTEKEMLNREIRKPIEWEKIFVNYTFDKGLIPRTYKELNSKTPLSD